ncbi:MAG: hypothetical protein R6V56_03070 [Lentisphaeria bacterium]
MGIPEDRQDKEENGSADHEIDKNKIRKIPLKREKTEEKNVAENTQPPETEASPEVKPAGEKRQISSHKLKSKPASATPAEEENGEAATGRQDVAEEKEKREAPASEEPDGEQAPPVAPPSGKPKVKLKKPIKKESGKKEAPEVANGVAPKTPPENSSEKVASESPGDGSETAEKGAEVAEKEEEPPPDKTESAPVKPRLQKGGGTKLPEHMQAPPQATGKGKKGKSKGRPTSPPQGGQEQDANGGTRRQITPYLALLMIIVGNLMTMKPAWVSWVKTGTIPVDQLASLGITVLVMAVLVIPRKTALRVIAAILAFLMVAGCIALLVLSALFADVLTKQPMGDVLLARMPEAEWLAASAAVLLGGFILLTGGAVVQWILAGVCVVAGAVLPWLPLTDWVPQLETPAPSAVYEALEVNLPGEWRPTDDSKSSVKGKRYTVPSEDLELIVRKHKTVRDLSLMEQTRNIQQQLKAQYPDKGHYLDELVGSPAKQRISVFGDIRVDILVVTREGRHYEVRITGGRPTFDSREALIEKTLKAF